MECYSQKKICFILDENDKVTVKRHGCFDNEYLKESDSVPEVVLPRKEMKNDGDF